MLVEIHVDRATIGRLNCDNQRIEMLEGVRPGTTLRMRCRNFLIIDAADGSALRATVAGGPTSGPLGPAGRLNGHRINLSSAGGPKDEGGHE
ncbi:MAG: hypothetical protein GWO04_10615 [Actinobacteria bacterium]|nr:hypothetical protein [Actinomycetota bacterium]NIW27407.1 hypothetical protein [Actinomycetota bacterium]